MIASNRKKGGVPTLIIKIGRKPWSDRRIVQLAVHSRIRLRGAVSNATRAFSCALRHIIISNSKLDRFLSSGQ